MNPIIETERLFIREILPTDVDGLFELDSNPEVHRYLRNEPITSKEQAAKAIAFIRQQYVDNGIGRWAMIDKKTNEFIGWTGFKWITEPINNHVNYHDIGYRLIQRYWGKGLATEAAIACMHYGFESLKLNEVHSFADAENTASNHILSKIGLKFIETFEYEGIAHNWYEIRS